MSEIENEVNEGLDSKYSPYEKALELISLIPGNKQLYRNALREDYSRLKKLKVALVELGKSTSEYIEVILDDNDAQNFNEKQINDEIHKIRVKAHFSSFTNMDNPPGHSAIDEPQSDISTFSLEELLLIDINEKNNIERIRELYADPEVRKIFMDQSLERNQGLELLQTGASLLPRINDIDALIQEADSHILLSRVKSFRSNTALSGKELSFISLIRKKIDELKEEKYELLLVRETATAYREQTLKNYQRQLSESGFVITPSRERLMSDIEEKILTGKNILLPGATGTGKTMIAIESVRRIAKHMGKDISETISGSKMKDELDDFVEVFSGTSDARPSDFIAKIRLVEGEKGGTETKTELGKILKAFVDGKIPVIDEIDLIPNDVLMRIKHLFTLKPGSKYSPQENGNERYELQNTTIIATANIKSEKHRDREDLDPAIIRLFDTLHITYLPEDETYDLALANLMQKEGFISGVGKEELSDRDSILPLLVYCLKKNEDNYLGKGEGETISNKSKKYLQKAVLELGKFMGLFVGFKESGESFEEYIRKGIIEFCSNTAYPKGDRLILLKIFSEKGLIRLTDINSLLERMDDVSKVELEENLLGGEAITKESEIAFIDPYELANLDPYEVHNLKKLDLLNKPDLLTPLLQELDSYLMNLEGDSGSDVRLDLEAVLFDILERSQGEEQSIVTEEEKESIISNLYELGEGEWVVKVGLLEEFKSLFEELLDRDEKGKNILTGIEVKNETTEERSEQGSDEEENLSKNPDYITLPKDFQPLSGMVVYLEGEQEGEGSEYTIMETTKSNGIVFNQDIGVGDIVDMKKKNMLLKKEQPREIQVLLDWKTQYPGWWEGNMYPGSEVVKLQNNCIQIGKTKWSREDMVLEGDEVEGKAIERSGVWYLDYDYAKKILKKDSPKLIIANVDVVESAESFLPDSPRQEDMKHIIELLGLKKVGYIDKEGRGEHIGHTYYNLGGTGFMSRKRYLYHSGVGSRRFPFTPIRTVLED